LAESTTRLWALEEHKNQIDGILYIPIGPKSIWRARKTYSPIIDIFSGGLPVIPETQAKNVERLIVPEPGFGHQDRMKGSEKYVNMMRRCVEDTIPAAGSNRLYISRTALYDRRGNAFGEHLIEEFMAANGYDIFHPQRHTAAEQLARYRAARYVAMLDGSAAHFAAYALQRNAKVMIIPRRKANVTKEMAGQLRRFAQADVTVADVIKQMWVKEGRSRIDYSSYAELDLVLLSEILFQNGFVSSPEKMQDMSKAEIYDYLQNREDDAPNLVPFQHG
jgi:capsular polysaccharide biosynthesis protein